jgi:hypothetical protein
MTCDQNVVFSCDGTDLVSMEANLEDQAGPIGGSLVCRDISGTVRIRLDAASEQFGGTTIWLRDGGIQLFNDQGKLRLAMAHGDPEESLDGGFIQLMAGTDAPSAMAMQESGHGSAIVLNASDRTVAISAPDGTQIVRLSAIGENAIDIRDAAGAERIQLNATNGRVILRNKSGTNRVELNGREGSVIVRGPDGVDRIDLLGATSEIVVRSPDHQTVLRLSGLDGSVRVGGGGNGGSINMFDSNGKETLTIDGDKGDILLQNADCAEDFEVASGVVVEPATVMVIEQSGMLSPSTRPYDRAVAGVASGGAGISPGIVLGHTSSAGFRFPIALAGRVHCQVDADFAAIQVGDLLTTSPTPGHAMKVTDHQRAFGAVLGKALSPLSSGRGTIPVLVALQ